MLYYDKIECHFWPLYTAKMFFREDVKGMENYGVLSLLPVAVVIVLVFLTKRTTVSLLAGTLVGAVMLYGVHFAKPWLEVVYGVMGSELWIWLVLVYFARSTGGGLGFENRELTLTESDNLYEVVLEALMAGPESGSLVALFEASGGIYGFTDIAAKICKGEKRTLLAGWLLGIVTFVDDWLSILSVGTAMRRATDRFHIPREMLAFLSNATASSICVIVPTSTWGVFMISQLVATGVCPSEAGMATFVATLPFLFYPFAALLCGLLYGVGVLPKFGPMRNAYTLAQQREVPVEQTEESSGKKPKARNFLLPVILVTGITIATGEILYGTLASLVFCALLYLPQRLMSPGKYLDTILTGFKDMIGVLFIVTSAFILRDINSLLGMPEFVIGVAKTAMSPQVLPVAAFLIVTLLAVAAGNFWGVCALSFPVIIPIAQALDTNVLLTAGAIISATAAGSHLCFFGAEATLACSSTGIENVRYAQTSVPMLVIPVGISILLYLAAGFFIG